MNLCDTRFVKIIHLCAEPFSKIYYVNTVCQYTFCCYKNMNLFLKGFSTLKHPHGRDVVIVRTAILFQRLPLQNTLTFIRDLKSFIRHIQWESDFIDVYSMIHTKWTMNHMDFRCLIDKIKSLMTKVRWQGCVLIDCCQRKNRQKYIIYK